VIRFMAGLLGQIERCVGPVAYAGGSGVDACP
jgi:hypothetical protein